MTETETTVAPPPLSMVHFLHLLLVNHSLKFLNKKFPLISSHYVDMYHLCLLYTSDAADERK